jgi:carboxyl-terminal processing protease
MEAARICRLIVAVGLVLPLALGSRLEAEDARTRRVRELVAAHFVGGPGAGCDGSCSLEDLMHRLDRHSRLIVGRAPDLDFIRGLRADEQSPEVTWDSSGGARIRLPAFGRRTAHEFREALNRAIRSHPRGLTIDLRGNPGGCLETALEIAGCFVPRGEPMLEVAGRSAVRRFESAGPRCIPRLPVDVLVDERTASSAEVLTWLLKRYADARIRGRCTAGKGTVQEVFRVDTATRLVLTTATYRLPDGSSLEGRGIEPDDRGVD